MKRPPFKGKRQALAGWLLLVVTTLHAFGRRLVRRHGPRMRHAWLTVGRALRICHCAAVERARGFYEAIRPRLLRTRGCPAWTVLALSLVLSAILVLSCKKGTEETETTTAGVAPPNTKRLIEATENRNRAQIPHVVLKPQVSDADAYEHLFELQDEIRTDMDQLVTHLLQAMPTDDAAHICTLRRVYSTGQFLHELECWLARADNGDLVRAEHRAELKRLNERWQGTEQLVTELARME